MKIIPAIDVIDGKCVRLTKGDYSTQLTYAEDPLEVAKEFEANGFKFLHLVDLDGARSQRIVNHKVLERIAKGTGLSIDFGGGIKSDEDLSIAFNSGANAITGGSIAVQNPELFLQWIETYGQQKIILGADALNRKVATNGWLEQSEVDVIKFIQSYEKQGIRKVICTDISKDGMLEGPSIALYSDILAQTNIELVASGGATTFDDLEKLRLIGCDSVIIGKAIYEGRLPLKQLAELC